MSNYQKVYMNQIHSSSLLCQLAQMWKSQMLCDAIIRTGNIITKAHRVVLVAACPMLQSMENAAAGSHLEVRLAADIKQDAVNTFLQYLYEGFMMLTEENCRDVEKVARLLQVDSVIKCCADFYKCIQSKTGAFVPSNYKYSFQDLVEFRHVRTTDLQKTTQDKIMKRTSEFSRPGSPGSKRQRIHTGDHSPDVSIIGSDRADDATSMAQSYKPAVPDPWDRVPYFESGISSRGTSSKPSQPGVIDIVEESLELVQHDPHNKDGHGSGQFSSQKSGVSIAVASQFNTEPDISVVNISQNRDQEQTASSSAPSCSRGNISVSPHTVEDSGGPSLFTSHRQQTITSQHEFSQQILYEQPQKHQGDFTLSNVTQGGEGNQKFTMMKSQQTQGQRGSEMCLTPTKQTSSLPQLSSQPKPYAIGSANQGMASPSSSLGSPSSSRNIPRRTPIPVGGPILSTACSQEMGYSEDTGGPSSIKTDDSSSGDLVPDLTIVKVERAHSQSESEEPVASSSSMNIVPETGGLDMHVDDDGGGLSSNQHSLVLEEGEDLSDTELEEWAKGEMSNEGNTSGDQVMMQSSFKDVGPKALPCHISESDLRQVWKGDVASKSNPDPFSDIPLQHRLSLEQLLNLKLQSKSAGNFAKNICECLFPELFGPDHLRLKYSYNGGGIKEKMALDVLRKEYLMRYVLYFYPELNNIILWKTVIVTSINECLRRPVRSKKF